MEQFKELEKKIRLAAERIQHLKAVRLELEQQVATLQDEQRGLKKRVAQLESGRDEQAASVKELDRMREERSEIKQRVEKLIGELADLDLDEQPSAGAKTTKAAGKKKAAPATATAVGG